MSKSLPLSSRYRCQHGILKPQFIWSLEAKPVPLTAEMPNPLCAVCSGPLPPGRKATLSTPSEANDPEILETANA
jgi:hypothetical protein